MMCQTFTAWCGLSGGVWACSESGCGLAARYRLWSGSRPWPGSFGTQRAQGVDHLGRERERQRDRFAIAPKLDGVEELGDLGMLTGLQAAQRHEPANHFLQVLSRSFVSGFNPKLSFEA